MLEFKRNFSTRVVNSNHLNQHDFFLFTQFSLKLQLCHMHCTYSNASTLTFSKNLHLKLCNFLKVWSLLLYGNAKTSVYFRCFAGNRLFLKENNEESTRAVSTKGRSQLKIKFSSEQTGLLFTNSKEKKKYVYCTAKHNGAC